MQRFLRNGCRHSSRLKLGRIKAFENRPPSIDEQKEITDFLEKKCAEIDALVTKKEQIVVELEAYKKSLIYEVVTGKREV